jgi:hypothetical protein
MTARRKQTRQTNGQARTFPIWLLVFVCIAIGAGAAAGTVLSGSIDAEISLGVGQALLVDGLAFGVDDVSYESGINLKRASVATADDDTGFQVAAEMAIGDKFLISLPLRNASKVALIGLITLEPSSSAGLLLDVDERSVLALTHETAEDAAARGAPLSAGTHTYNVRYWPLADADGDGIVGTADIIMTPAGGGTVAVDAVNAMLGQITYTITGAVTALTVDYWYGSEITILCQVGPNQWKFQAADTVGQNKSGDIEVIVANPDNASPGYYRVRGTIEPLGY